MVLDSADVEEGLLSQTVKCGLTTWSDSEQRRQEAPAPCPAPGGCTLHFVVSFGLWIALLIVASCVLLNRSQYKTPTCQISITNVIWCVCKSSWFHVSLICYNLFGKARIFSDWKWPPPNPHHGFLWQSLVLCTHMISHLMHSPGFQKSGPLKVLLNFNSVDKLRSEWYQRLSLSHISTDSNELRGQKVQLWAQKTDICCSWIYNWWPSLL